MKTFALILMAAVFAFAPAAWAAEPQCRYKGDPAACAPYACIPLTAAGQPDTRDPDLIPKDTPGRCGVCTDEVQCGGAQCLLTGNQPGTCARHDGSPPPEPIRPWFGLLVADLSFNFADRANTPARPVVSAGYVAQVALRQTRPMVRAGGGFIEPDPPSWYGEVGLSAAFAGPAQNLFASAGLVYYRPSLPFSITTLGFGALYQRRGASVWDVRDTNENEDRLGPSVSVGFLQNVYVRGAYVLGLSGSEKHGAAIVSVLYMRDLFNDLLSPRFRKYLPQALR